MSFLTKDEEKFLANLKVKILNLIDKEFEKQCLDRVYFPFFVKMEILSTVNLSKLGEVILLDEMTKYCTFCGKETRYYDDNIQGYICINCFSKLYGRKS